MSKKTESSMFYDEKTGELKINPRSILVIDAEERMLPFSYPTGKDGIIIREISSFPEFKAMLKAAINSKTIELIFIDSFTRLLYWIEKDLKARGLTGFTLWGEYASEIEDLFMEYTSANKFIVFTSHDHLTQDNDSIMRKTAYAQGRLSGKVEGFFDVVVHTHVNPTKDVSERYMFEVHPVTGKTSTKTHQLFPDKSYIPNNLALILGAIYKMRGIGDNPTMRRDKVLLVGKSGSGKSTSLKYAIKEN